MNTLTPADITALLAKGGYKRNRTVNSSKSHYVRVDGILTRVSGSPKASQVGKFEGKVGGTKRSRKGRTTRLPNGSRKYIKPYENEVVMY